MKIEVKVVTRAKKNEISFRDNKMIIHTSEIPDKNKANNKILKMVAEYYHMAKRNISIIKGNKSNHKILNIANTNFTNINANINNTRTDKFKKHISRIHCWER